jgi:hypothetical protein
MVEDLRRIRIFSWHIHGSYLFYLSLGNFEIYVPINEKKSEGYIGRGSTFPFGSNVIEIPAEQVSQLTFDCILFQTPRNYTRDQFEILSEKQRQLPKIYLEHDPPQGVPTDTKHFVQDPDVELIHVTHFNRLMWDNGPTPTRVIDHGVVTPSATYTGEIAKGIVVINNLGDRGRRLGLDVFNEVRKHVPVDLIGMDSKKLGGLGEILHPQLPNFISKYRFFFNPIRYTSLGLAVLEAMMTGVPVVGLATTEMVTVIRDGESGFLHTDINYLISRMKDLLANRELAQRLGAAGRKVAMDRFNIQRFNADWHRILSGIIKKRTVEFAA